MANSQDRSAACNVKLCRCLSPKHPACYHCTFCNEDICSKCLLDHQLTSSKTKNVHNIVHYKDKKRNKTYRGPCKTHEKPTTAYCEECKLLICHECTEENHKQHKSKMLTDLLREKIDEIYYAKEHLSQSLDLVKEYNAFLQLYRRTCEQMFNTSEHEIVQQANIFKQIVDKWKHKMIKKAKQEKYKLLEFADCKEFKIHNRGGKEIKRQMNNLDKIFRNLETLHNPQRLDISKLVNFIQESVNLKAELDNLKAEIDTPPRLILSTSKFDVKHLCAFANIILSTSNDIINDSDICEIKQSFDEIQDMSCDHKTSALLVVNDKTKKIVRINSVDQKQDTYDTISIPFRIAVCNQGIIYAADKSIQLICGKEDKCISLRREEDWNCRGIAVTELGSVLICQKSWKEERARVFILNTDMGKEEDIIEYDKVGKPLYIDPKYIAVNNLNGDVCVTDHEALIVVEKSGKYRFTYPESSFHCKFNPQNICVDSRGHILILNIISNWLTNIHVLNRDGQLLRCLMSLQLQDVTALTIDCHDFLFIAGRENDTTKIKKIALCEVLR